MILDRNMAERQRSAPPGRLMTPVFLLVTLSTFAYFVSIGALIPTLPRFVEGPLGRGEASVGLAVGAFAISAVLIRPLIGRLGDVRGRRILMLAGSAVVGSSVLGLVLIDSFLPLLALRVLTGVGEAAFYVGAASAINDLAPDERRGEAMSLFSLALYGGLAVGPILGEWVLGDGDFTLTWIVAAASTFVATALAVAVPDTRGEDDSPAPETPAKRRFVHPDGLLPGIILATSVWGLAGFNTLVPLYALELGMPGSRTVFFVYSGIVLGFRSFGARIPDRFGSRRTGRTALAFSTAGLALVAAWEAAAGLFIGASIFAIGQALAFPTLMSLALSRAPRRERGAVVGTFTAFFDLAFGLGALALGAIAQAVGFSGAFLCASLVALGGLLLMLGFARREDKRTRRAERVEEYQEPIT